MKVAVLQLQGLSAGPTELAGMLAEQGHEVLAVVPGHGTPRRRAAPGLEVRAIEGSAPIAAAAVGSALLPQWRRRPPDVVHAFGLAGAVAALEATAGEVPVVVSLGAVGPAHGRGGTPAPAPRGRRVARERSRLQAAAHGVAGCAEHAMDLLRLSVPAHRLSVVPMAVDSQAYRLAGPVPSTDDICLLSLDGTHPASGLSTLLDALAMTPGVRLTVVGPTDDEGRTKAWTAARRLHLGGRLRLLGEVRPMAVPRALGDHHGLVAASSDQPWCRPVLESLACGRPVVSLGVGATHEFVIDGETGAVAARADAEGLAAALARFRDDELAAPGGRHAAARASVVRRHAWAARSAALTAAYQQAQLHGAARWQAGATVA